MTTIDQRPDDRRRELRPARRRLISADSHVTEPLTLWDRLPDHLRSQAPHIEVKEGRTCVVVEGRILTRFRVPSELRRDTRWVNGDAIPERAELTRRAEREELEQMSRRSRRCT